MKKHLPIVLALSVAIPLLFTSCGEEPPEPIAKPAINKQNGNGNGGGGNSGGLPLGFLADTTAMNRTAVLEDFTGVRCQFCPDGHDIAKTISNSNPTSFIVLAVHGGTYATPAAGWEDFTTPFAQDLINQADVSGYPAGTISRIEASVLGVTPQKPNGYAMSRSDWSNAANTVMNMSAPVNIGLIATVNTTSRELTVAVDLYFTDNEPNMSHLNVALIEDSLLSKQSTTTGIDNAYYQNNVLRHLLTGQWGEMVKTTAAKGDYVRKTYTYTIPAEYNTGSPVSGGLVVLENLRVVAFVTRGQTDITNAEQTDVIITP